MQLCDALALAMACNEEEHLSSAAAPAGGAAAAMKAYSIASASSGLSVTVVDRTLADRGLAGGSPG